MINHQTACHLVQTAADALQSSPRALHEVLDDIAAALYATDADGTVTYFNKACIKLAGRTPKVGSDKWCVTWKLFTVDGKYLPHDQCPMAAAIREKQPIRDAEAVAERPDGSRISFVPYPTPVFDGSGELVGAVNLLVDVTEQRSAQQLEDQAVRCRRLASRTTDSQTAGTLRLLASKFDKQARRLP
jgi:PAS domain S-box-containing protein